MRIPLPRDPCAKVDWGRVDHSQCELHRIKHVSRAMAV